MNEIPTCKSIPQKGIKSDKKWDFGMKGTIGEVVNLQNAEVTKMLDNKSEQK